VKREEDCRSIEQGPIRPPSEARSLLIRVTRNCPWNRCAFCHTYQGETFSLRPFAEIKGEILRIAAMAEQIRALAGKNDAKIGGGSIGTLFDRQGEYDALFQSVAAWLLSGGESVFLQDADSLVLKTDDLEEVIAFIRGTFPSIKRITTYARAKTAAKKNVAELKRLHEAGLSRIHVGMESGYDPLLAFIRKGVTAAEQVEGGLKIREAGISLCEYVIPGLGGSWWSREHAVETARVLNRINPDHIRLRTLQVVDGTKLAEKVRNREFQPLDDEAILGEIRLFFETLEGIQSEIVSDHILNLLEELEGKLPGDHARILGVIDRFINLSGEERMIFMLGRRMGIYRRLADLADRHIYDRLGQILDGYRGKDQSRLQVDLASIKRGYI
jgi:histone acetyltransferase (RNA polymerase elongator complex component)